MIVKSLADIPANKVDMEGVQGASKQLVLGTADGAPNFAMRVFTLEPGGHTPHHEHPFEHLTYAIAGRGVVVDPEGNERPFGGGDFAMVPPNEKHQFRNTSTAEPLQLVPADFKFGRSEEQAGGKFAFNSGGTPTNSVQVNGRRTDGSASGPVPLFFGKL